VVAGIREGGAKHLPIHLFLHMMTEMGLVEMSEDTLGPAGETRRPLGVICQGIRLVRERSSFGRSGDDGWPDTNLGPNRRWSNGDRRWYDKLMRKLNRV